MRNIIFAFLCVLSFCIHADDNKNDYAYHYWGLKASEQRDEYQYRLLELALKKTVPSYGPYELTKNNEKYTALRVLRELERGRAFNINILPATTRPFAEADAQRSFVIKTPLFKGLLGYRQLIVRRSDLAKFEHINSIAELQGLVAGQGQAWEDVNIYRYNGYSVVENANFFNLFAMLAASRFDYIPLSVIEINDIMTRFSKYSKDFAVVPNMIIYYPFPVHYNISIHYPKLVERLTQGLDIAQTDGSFRQLLEYYFADELTKLKTKNLKVFILKRPNISKSLGLDKPILLHDYKEMQ